MDAVQPLKENWTALVHVVSGSGAQTTPVSKLVTKIEPLSLNQNLKSLKNYMQISKAAKEFVWLP